MILREFVFLPCRRLPYNVLSYPEPSFICDFSLCAAWSCTQMCERKSANKMDRARMNELSPETRKCLRFYYFFFTAFPPYFRSLPLPPSLTLLLSLFPSPSPPTYSRVELLFYSYIWIYARRNAIVRSRRFSPREISC